MFLFNGPFATKIGEIVHGVHLHDPMEAENHPSRLSGIMVPPRPRISDPRAKNHGIPQMGGSRPGKWSHRPSRALGMQKRPVARPGDRCAAPRTAIYAKMVPAGVKISDPMPII